MNTMTVPTATQTVISANQLLAHWQGHRSLTRRVIEAFPEDKLFTYSVGGMRPFGEMAIEMLGMTTPSLQGVVSRTWQDYKDIEIYQPANKPTTKAALLQCWDDSTEEVNKLWKQIPAERFQEVDLAFGQWEGPIYWLLFYDIDNEIHHRAQGYVYLRSLGIEPPPFWER